LVNDILNKLYCSAIDVMDGAYTFCKDGRLLNRCTVVRECDVTDGMLIYARVVLIASNPVVVDVNDGA
jgi:hypothetical protein